MTRHLLPFALILAGCGLLNQEGPKLNTAIDEADADTDTDSDADTDTAAEVCVVYLDGDSDGYGGATVFDADCDDIPPGYVADSTDCDDADAGINPGASEVCDGVTDENCNGNVDEAVTTTFYADADSDGQGSASAPTEACSVPAGYVDNTDDCDDANASVYLGASETCNGLDDDCDTTIDEPDAVDARTWYADSDADTFGNASVGQITCDQPPSFVSDSTDCDDTNAGINPGASEVCDGLTDENCDGTVDESTAIDASTWYADSDADSYGDVTISIVDCAAPAGYVADATDCDDGNGSVSPAATETCNGLDDDCDGATDPSTSVDASTWYADFDVDGYGDPATSQNACEQPADYLADASDCNAYDPDVYPGATEYCNGVDDNCDGVTDEDTAADASTFYADADGDSYGDPTNSTVSCSVPSGYVADATDCDDATAGDMLDDDLDDYTECESDCSDVNDGVYPGATEYADGRDNDCDGDIDEETDASDEDGDGYTEDAGDCDDGDASVNTSAVELCDGIDNDCDEDTDEASAADATTWYPDDDADGYGDSAVSIIQCDQPSGFVANATDCDDHDASFNPGAAEDCSDPIDYNCDGSVGYADVDGDGVAACDDCNDTEADAYPGAIEVCDGIDNDCDDSTDPDSSLDASTWYADGDADSYGDPTSSALSCDVPSGYVADATDCDDNQRTTYPGAVEYGNGVDDDCDGSVDDGTDASDEDGDGYTEDAGDCDDGDASVNTSAVELCDGIDNDCDEDTDEASAADATTWYPDDDADGYGDSAVSIIQCDQPSGFVANATDCDDHDALFSPGATEVCTDSTDYNCDGSVAYADVDGDGVAACEDCDDTEADAYPGATEVCDGIDNDCDGSTDPSTSTGASTWYEDGDSDGYGAPTSSTVSCTAPSGYVADATDCDDDQRTSYPGATEFCNELDDDCDGAVDDSASSAPSWYVDDDGDGYGDASTSAVDCTAPSGYVADATDCDDSASVINPEAVEACASLDLDCDGTLGTSDADANCDVPLDCADNGDGTVTATFTITSGSTTAWQGTIVPVTINLYLWDIGSVTSAAYAGDDLAHSQTFATSSFTPEAEDSVGNTEWANLNAWYVTSTCTSLYEVEINAAGNALNFEYVGP